MPRPKRPRDSGEDYDISANLVPDESDVEDTSPSTGNILDSALFDTLDEPAEDDDDDEEFTTIAAQQLAAQRKAAIKSGKASKKSGGFQSFGLNSQLLKAITKKGFAVPTPIQRKAIPLILEGQDVVGMARTGSGKTAAFVIPMIEKLKSHSAQFGARAVIMSPSRELALQTLRVVKDFGRGTDLRSVLLVGGDSMEDQFSQMTSNPDLIIATPGRFMHLLFEMSLDLSSVKYVVFDEADRLFEMGFAIQLNELLHALPTSRQTLLFSATLPKSLVDFAKAGLREPTLVRLDAETKVSADLQSAYLTVKNADREAALLHLLQDVILMPLSSRQHKDDDEPETEPRNSKKRKRSGTASHGHPHAHSTIIFCATKHHVEYLSGLLRHLGYGVSYVYGSLDQTARKIQVENFRSGITSILVVTDVAARGIDMPMLANVINFNFPSQPKIFIHRVGRTARAGQKGWSYSLVQESDLPYVLDLQLLLGRKLVKGRQYELKPTFADDMVMGSIPRRKLESAAETFLNSLERDKDLAALRDVALKGEKLYTRTRNPASNESAKRARQLSSEGALTQLNMLYDEDSDAEGTENQQMLARISNYRPSETIFEIGKRGMGGDVSQVMRKRKAAKATGKAQETAVTNDPLLSNGEVNGNGNHINADTSQPSEDVLPEVYSDDEFEVSFPTATKNNSSKREDQSFMDEDHFMSYEPKTQDFTEDRGYGVHSGSYNSTKDASFAAAARTAVMDLVNDESSGFALPSKPRQMRWDKRSKNYVATANDTDGSKGPRMIASESGQKVAASFRSGRFDSWKRSHKVDGMPRTGELERSASQSGRGGSLNYKHRAMRAPKAPDKYRDDYYKKKKRQEAARAEQPEGRTVGPRTSSSRNELRSVDDVRKQRALKERRREKNARPSRKRKG